MPSLRNRVEAVLFVATEPVSLDQLCEATGEPSRRVLAALRELRESLEDRGIALREIGGGYRLHSHPDAREDVERYLLPPKTYMSPASLETLAIVAYLQPVTRAEIESIRGVNVDGVMGTLEERQLVRELGRKDVVGRPILYGTTSQFLEAFGLRSVDELPPLPEDAPRRVNGQVIAFPQSQAKAAAIEQIHESIEGHEDEIHAKADAKLDDSVADELKRAMNGSS
ncbi:MAG TPA: SMC-Scp complex subunit ScpB [Candidatus Acidoferrales bacterium]|nr:SMC-Scp complex subunit ScpB [Candidatus Acidoferrales bacterium]